MLSDESRPTARVLSDDVSPATREKRPVSRKKLKNLPLTSSHSKSGRPGEIFQLRGRYHAIETPIILTKTANLAAKSETYSVGSALSRVRDQDMLIEPRRSLDSDERFVRINF